MSMYTIKITEEALEDIVKIYGSFNDGRYENHRMELEKDSEGNLSNLIVTANIPEGANSEMYSMRISERYPIIKIPLEKSIENEEMWSI